MPPAIMKHINWSRSKRRNRVEYRWCLFCCLASRNFYFLKKYLRIWWISTLIFPLTTHSLYNQVQISVFSLNSYTHHRQVLHPPRLHWNCFARSQMTPNYQTSWHFNLYIFEYSETHILKHSLFLKTLSSCNLTTSHFYGWPFSHLFCQVLILHLTLKC